MLPENLKLEHQRNHRVKSEFSTHRPTNDLPCWAPAGTDCFFCIIHRGTAVATRLIVSFLKVLQVRIKAAMSRKRLRQVEADFTLLSIQPGSELREQTVSPSHGLLTMPSRLPSLEVFMSSSLTDCFLCTSDYLLVGRTGRLLVELGGLLPYLR